MKYLLKNGRQDLMIFFDYTMLCTNKKMDKKSNLRVTENYRGITFTATTAKVYNDLLLNHIWCEVEKILRKNQNGFWRKWSISWQILTIHRIIKGVHAKYQGSKFVDFSIWFYAQRKDGANISLPKETVSAIMMHYKAIVPSSDDDTDFFDIVTGVLPGGILVSLILSA